MSCYIKIPQLHRSTNLEYLFQTEERLSGRRTKIKSVNIYLGHFSNRSTDEMYKNSIDDFA